MHTYIHTYIPTYIHIYTRTHTDTHTSRAIKSISHPIPASHIYHTITPHTKYIHYIPTPREGGWLCRQADRT